jgi:hypothetical protein
VSCIVRETIPRLVATKSLGLLSPVYCVIGRAGAQTDRAMTWGAPHALDCCKNVSDGSAKYPDGAEATAPGSTVVDTMLIRKRQALLRLTER